jgi:hypothetical protein
MAMSSQSSQTSVDRQGNVGPRPSFERSLVKFDHFGLRQPVEGGAQDEAEIVGSRPLFGSFLGFGNM